MGGGQRCSAIVDKLGAHDADVVVLTEFRNGNSGTLLQSRLVELGYGWQHVATDARKKNSVAIFSRLEFTAKSADELAVEERYRCLIAEFAKVTVLGVYFGQNELKEPLWNFICDYAERNREGRHVIVGDFNTGAPDLDGAEFHCSEHFAKLSSLWRDCWRHFHGDDKEYSWLSKRAGWRIDHAFVSPALVSELESCEYSHDERQASPPISDHSVLVCTFNSGR